MRREDMKSAEIVYIKQYIISAPFAPILRSLRFYLLMLPFPPE